MTLFSSLSGREEQTRGGGSPPFADSSPGLGATAQEGLANAAERIKAAINDYPATALGAALATGVILGWMFKRR
jgi:hypothetical protein